MTKNKSSSIGRLVLILLVVIVAIGAGWAWWVYKHPLATFVKNARQTLESLGFEKMETEVAGRRLVYFRGGEGPTLVLLHGAGDQAGTWAPIAEELMQEYELVLLDLPGHGDSEPADGPLPFGEVVGGFEAFLDAEARDGPVTLVGNSMGAWLATLQAHRHPETVQRIVLVNGGPITGDPSNPSLTPSNREEARRLMDLLRDPDSPKTPDFVLDDIVRRSNSGPIGRMLQESASFGEYLLDGQLGEITTPVELVWGESDRLMSLDYAERMLDGLPRARLTGVTKCGHIPQAECPQRFVATLLSVLASEPPPIQVAPEGGTDLEGGSDEETEHDSR